MIDGLANILSESVLFCVCDQHSLHFTRIKRRCSRILVRSKLMSFDACNNKPFIVIRSLKFIICYEKSMENVSKYTTFTRKINFLM